MDCEASWYSCGLSERKGELNNIHFNFNHIHYPMGTPDSKPQQKNMKKNFYYHYFQYVQYPVALSFAARSERSGEEKGFQPHRERRKGSWTLLKNSFRSIKKQELQYDKLMWFKTAMFRRRSSARTFIYYPLKLSPHSHPHPVRGSMKCSRSGRFFTEVRDASFFRALRSTRRLRCYYSYFPRPPLFNFGSVGRI